MPLIVQSRLAPHLPFLDESSAGQFCAPPFLRVLGSSRCGVLHNRFAGSRRSAAFQRVGTPLLLPLLLWDGFFSPFPGSGRFFFDGSFLLAVRVRCVGGQFIHGPSSCFLYLTDGLRFCILRPLRALVQLLKVFLFHDPGRLLGKQHIPAFDLGFAHFGLFLELWQSSHLKKRNASQIETHFDIFLPVVGIGTP
ncbi:hypothetical protein [Dysosmobacter sp. Sow4_B12]|uniref:hypothetical protein n=1 Tax=Dysosmobacter sp. Sow4_B12 TaxID=3438777 RepID=UPI003F8E8D06